MSNPNPTFYVCIQTSSSLWAIPTDDFAPENHMRIYLRDNQPQSDHDGFSADLSFTVPDGAIVLDSRDPESVSDQELANLDELFELGLVFSTPWSCCGYISRHAHLRGASHASPSSPLEAEVGAGTVLLRELG